MDSGRLSVTDNNSECVILFSLIFSGKFVSLDDYLVVVIRSESRKQFTSTPEIFLFFLIILNLLFLFFNFPR